MLKGLRFPAKKAVVKDLPQCPVVPEFVPRLAGQTHRHGVKWGKEPKYPQDRPLVAPASRIHNSKKEIELCAYLVGNVVATC